MNASRFIVATALAAGFASASRAQTVDYGALEKLFAEPVTTSATGSPQRASDAPADMEIVTADDIRRSGAIDIPGVLRHVAGVDVLQWTNDTADVGVGGYNQPFSSRLLVLIDGRQVYADFYGFTPWSTLPVELDAIRQIEIVKGPNSALFGFNAVGGVINIITSSPLYDDVNVATLRAGTQGLAEASVVSTYKFDDRAAIRIEAGGRSNNEFQTDSSPAAEPNRHGNDRGEVDVNGLLQLTDDVQLGLEISHTRSDVTELIPTVYSLAFSHYRTDSVKAQLTADTSLGLVQATAYGNWFHWNGGPIGGTASLGVPGEIMGETSPIEANNSVAVASAQDLVKLGSDHTLRLSAEYRRTSVGTTPVEGGKVSYTVVSGAGMWEWKILPALSLTNALRLDYLDLSRSGALAPFVPFANPLWDRSITEPSYNSGLVWQPTELDTLRATASRGVQLPNVEDLGGLQDTITSAALPIALTGIPSLAPTIVNNYEVGWDRQLSGFDALLRISAFIQSTHGLVSNIGSFSLLPNVFLITPAALGHSNAEGLELEIKGRFGQGWRWGLSYTPEIITDHLALNPINRLFVIDFQHTMPTHVVNADLGWSGGRWEIDGYLRYESAFYGLEPEGMFPTLTRIDDYVSIDGRIAYSLTDWATLALSAQNLGQSSQTQTAAPPVERRVIGSFTARF
ncbi:MAG TPA: TonB-dependent receptor [Alphaproteobacteria bacterium]|nr:TonB-dependent receptor [Alphaproteobacteria bacterium]